MAKFKALSSFDLKFKINATEVGLELKRLGTFTPLDVLNAAKSPKSPLHKYFEWDDSKAAHAFRLSQARHLVLSIVVDIDGQFIRQYESVVIDERRMYIPVEKISESEDLIEQVLRTALNEALFFKEKHQKYSYFFGQVFDAIDKAEGTYRSRYEKKKGRRSGAEGDKARHSADKKANRKGDNHRRLTAAR